MKLLKLPQVREITQFSTTTIYRLMAKGKFPKQIKLAERTVRWIENEIHDFINQKITERDG